MSKGTEDRPCGLRALGNAYLSRRYTILFYSLLITIVAGPVLSAFELRGVLMELLLAANLLAAVMPVNAGRSRRFIFVVMFIVWLARPLTAWFDHPVLSVMTLGIWTVIGLFAAVAALVLP
jgi:hypothetical protein